MSTLTGVIIAIAVAILVGVYVSWRAGRLDRLHARVETARAVLDAALVRRSSVALELAACGLLDPATSLLLAGAAHDARAAGEPNELAESDLSRALRQPLRQPFGRNRMMVFIPMQQPGRASLALPTLRGKRRFAGPQTVVEL